MPEILVYVTPSMVGMELGDENALRREIEQLDQHDAILFFSRALAYFGKLGWYDASRQLKYLESIVSDQLYSRLEKSISRDSKLLPLSPQQLLLILKLLIVAGRPNPDNIICHTVPPERLGRILLWANHHLDPEFSQPGTSTAEKAVESLIRAWGYRTKSMPELKRTIARYFSMYARLAPEIGRDCGFDLDRLLQEVLGLSVTQYFSAGFGLLVARTRHSLEDLRTGSVITLNRSSHFAETSLSPAAAQEFLSTISLPIQDYAVVLQAKESDLPMSQRFLALAQYPLVELDDGQLCVLSPGHLDDAISSGLHHIFLRHNDGQVRQEYLNFNGLLVQRYVEEVFRDIAQRDSSFRLIVQPVHAKGELTDILLDADPNLFLFESKSSQLRQANLASGRLDDYLKDFHDRFIAEKRPDGTTRPRGLGQLVVATGVLGSDGLPHEGVGPTDPSRVIPTLITPGSLPQFHLLWERYLAMLSTDYPDFEVENQHPQLLDLSGLDILDALVDHGQSVAGVLLEKVRYPHYRFLEFGDFAFQRYRTLRSALVSARTERLFAEAVDEFQLEMFPGSTPPSRAP